MYNPYRQLTNPLTTRQRRPQQTLLSQQEEETLAAQLARQGLSSVAYIGESLDKPMAAVRGALAGRPEELANLIPFSDALGITSSEGWLGGTPAQLTDDENTVYGRDLLEHYGVLNRNKEGFGGSGREWDLADAAGDVAGFAIDLIGPPVALTTKAVTRGGSALRASGVLDEAAVVAGTLGRSAKPSALGSVDDAIRMTANPAESLAKFQRAAGGVQGDDLAKLLKQRVGYRAALKAPLGFGKGTINLEPVVDPALALARKVTPEWATNAAQTTTAALRGALDGRANNMYGRQAQQEVAPLLNQKRAVLQRNARDVTSDVADTVHRHNTLFEKLGDGDITTGVYRLYETSPDQFDQLASRLTVDELKLLAPSYDRVRQTLDTIPGAQNQLGVSSFQLEDDFAQYMNRSVLGKGQNRLTSPANRTMAGVDAAGNLQRSEYLKNIPGGTATLRELGKRSVGMSAEEIAATARKMGVPEDQAKAVAGFIVDLAPEVRQAGIYTDPINAMAKRLESAVRGQSNADTLADTFANHDLLQRSLSGTPAGTPHAKLGEVAARLGIETPEQQKAFLTEVARRRAANAPSGTQLSPQIDLEDLANLSVGQKLARDLANLNPELRGPSPIKPLLDAYDSVTSLFKGLVTSPFPAFNARNRVSGAVRESLAGSNPLTSLIGLRGGGANNADNVASKLSRGMALNPKEAAQVRAIPGISEYMEQGSSLEDALRRLVYREMPGQGQGYGLDTARDVSRQSAGQSLDEITDIGMVGGTGGSDPFSFREAASRLLPRSLSEVNPFNLRGVLDGPAGLSGVPRTRTGFTPVASGQFIGGHAENLNRVAPFLKRIFAGADPAQAARDVLETQVDYSAQALSKFENDVLTRILPFYKFSRGNMPYVAKQLLTDPGGRTAALLRAPNAGHRVGGTENQVLPDYVAEGLAIPWGNTPDGSSRFVRGLGLMEEDLFGVIDPQNAAKGLLDELGSRLNPLLKAPLEYKTGQSFFQVGRDLDQMDPTLGRIASNLKGLATGVPQEQPAWRPGLLDHLVANSPLGRLSTTARQMTDVRKLPAFLGGTDKAGGLPLLANLLSGIKVSDVSANAMDKQLRDLVGETYSNLGGRTFEQTYVPLDVQARMGPQERMQYEQLKAMLRMLNKRRQQRALLSY